MIAVAMNGTPKPGRRLLQDRGADAVVLGVGDAAVEGRACRSATLITAFASPAEVFGLCRLAVVVQFCSASSAVSA